MDFSQNYEQVLNNLNYNPDKESLKHNINKNSPLLPFKTREPERAIFDNGFSAVLGELSRILLNKTWVDDIEVKKIISNIIRDVDIEEGKEDYLEKIIKEYLFDEKNELKIFDPYLFLYIPLSPNSRAKGEKDIALFFRDIFCRSNNLDDFFENKGSEHIIINLILNNISNLSEKELDYHYIPVLNNVIDLFNKDLEFLLEHPKFLIDHMDIFFAYYYYFYVSQLTLKISKGFNADDNVDDLFYLLDWESASRNRKSLEKGYSFLKNQSNSLFAKMSLLDQLNTLLGTKGYLECDMLDYFNDLDLNSQQNLLSYLRKWVLKYRDIRGFEEIEIANEFNDEKLSDDFINLINILFNSLNDVKYGIAAEPKSRYALNLEAIAKGYVLKRRGSYGYVLNVNRDLLRIMTALCVKDKKIKLNQLFEEFEKRGLYFDRLSQAEVVTFLTKLNLIDKKSDSEDAQYVKPVL